MNIINILYSKEYWFSVRSEYACKITYISFVIPLFVRSNNFNNNNIKSQIIRFRVLRSGDPGIKAGFISGEAGDISKTTVDS